MPALLIGPVLIALVALWAPVRGFARSLAHVASPTSGSRLRKPGAVLLATGVFFGSLVFGGATSAAAAITYSGHIGSAVGSPCTASSSQVFANDDNHVDQSNPSSNQDPSHNHIHIQSRAGDNQRGFVKFPMPSIPPNCQVASATLRLRVNSWDDNRDIEVQRVNGSWTENTITWNNQPGVAGAIVTQPSDDNELNFGVGALVTDLYVDGNHGFRIKDANESAGSIFENSFHSSESSDDPRLTITWGSPVQTTTTITVGAGGVAAGRSILLSFGMDDTPGALSASDSAGNIYSLDVAATNTGDVRTAILSAHDVNALAAGGTITVTHPNTDARGLSAFQFSGISPTAPRDATGTGQGTSSSPSTSAASTTQSDELVFGSISAGTGSFTPGAGFTGLPQASGPLGSVNSEYRIVSATGSYVANGSLGSSTVWAAAVATYRMDINAPVVAVTQPGDGTSTNDTTPTISGTSGSLNSDSLTVTAGIYLGVGTGGPVVQTLPATRAGNGNWSITAGSLPDGVYTVQATQTDGAGNTGTSGANTFTVDATAPTVPTFDSTPGQGSSTTPSWSFSGEVGASFECKLDKGAMPISGWASCTSPKAYTLVDGDGVYTISVRQTDDAGNVSPVATDAYTLDTDVPDTVINSGPNGTTGNPDPSFTFSSPDGSATFECQLDGGGFAPCSSPKSYVGLSEAPHTFQVRALDPVGNTDATPAERNFTIDTSLPLEPTLTGPSQDPDDDDTPTWDFSGEAGATFECRLEKDGLVVTDWTGCTSPQTPTLTGDGTYTFLVRQIDGGGNTSGAASDDYTFDTTTPAAPSLVGPVPDPDRIITPQWTFSGEPAATFECKLEKGALVVSDWSACTSPESFTLVDGDGQYTFGVRQTDQVGHTSAATTDTYDLDATAPETTIDSGPSGPVPTGDVSFTFSSPDPTASFECRFDGSGWGACTSPHDLNGLSEDSHIFEVRAADGVGNIDASPAASNFVVDLTVPSEPNLTGPAQHSSNDDTPTWTFTGEPGATFECKLEKDGSLVYDWTLCAGPQTPTLTSDGEYVFSVRQTDAAGNTSAAASDDYIFDTTAPAAPSLNGPSPDPGNVTTPEWTFSGEDGATFECKLEKGALVISDWTMCSNPDAHTLVDGDGIYTFGVRQIDEAGNTGLAASDTYELVTAGPDTMIDSGPSGSINTPDVSFTFSSVDPSATFECSLDGAVFAPCTSPTDINGLGDGPHTFEVRSVDSLGNPDPSPAASGFFVDTQDPEAPTVNDPNPNPGNDDMPSWSINGEAGATFECKLEKGGTTLSDWLSCGSPVSYTLTDGDGTYTLHVRQLDAAGNVSPVVTSEYDFDTTAPAAPTISSPDPNPGNLTVPSWDFSGEPGATFECKLEKDGIEIEPFTACVAPELYGLSDGDGDYVFTVRQTDEAGNLGQEASDTYTLDTDAPETTIDSGPSGSVATADVTFTFSADDPVADFQCNLDGAGFTSCTSPKDYTSLPDGGHTFQVRAVDVAGNVGRHPRRAVVLERHARSDADDRLGAVGPGQRSVADMDVLLRRAGRNVRVPLGGFRRSLRSVGAVRLTDDDLRPHGCGRRHLHLQCEGDGPGR